jgi:hypothetical protein
MELDELHEILDEEVRWLRNDVEAGDDMLAPRLERMERAKAIADELEAVV